jgi:hypothetical protein
MRDDFPFAVVRDIAGRAAHRCSNPECRAQTSGPRSGEANSINLGEAAHITAASPGGKRYDASLTAEQRKAAINGIWLCRTCAKLIDNDEARFPVEQSRTS